jgi:hypothetical protein
MFVFTLDSNKIHRYLDAFVLVFIWVFLNDMLRSYIIKITFKLGV